VQRIYLDELGDPNQQPVGINLIQLTIVPETQMAERARQLIERVQQEKTSILSKNEIIEVVTTIAVYKFTSLSREEVEAMLGLSLEETRIYRDLEHQTKLKAASRLLSKGYSVEEVAEAVDLAIEEVRQIVPQQ
jgi:predicted transposase/invertase (TIGR01784 family)